MNMQMSIWIESGKAMSKLLVPFLSIYIDPYMINLPMFFFFCFFFFLQIFRNK